VDSATGTFRESDSADFSVTTNNYSGYTLSIHAAVDDEDYSKLVNGNSVLNSISSASSASGFNNGNWGYKPSKLNSAANDSFQPAPTYEGTTLDTTAQANNEANTYGISIGAKANYGLAAGKYSNTFVITAVANPVGYSITYNKNTEDTVTNMPSNQTGDASAQSIEISSTTPSRSGYTFVDWCDGTTTTTSSVDSCTGTVYHPGDDYDTDQTAQNNLVLKAMWQQQVASGYTINFDANNGTGSMNPQVIPYGESDNLDANTFTRTNYVFDGWNTASDGNGTDYADEASFTAPVDDTGGSSITLYAKWRAAVYDTIIFDGNGADGGSMSNQQIMQGTSADLTTNAYTKTGYGFNGWSTTTDDLGQGYGDEDKYYAADTGTANTVTLYAKWVQPVCIENCDSQDQNERVYESGITIQRAYEMAYTQHQMGMYEETQNGNGIYEQVDSWDPINPEQYKGYDVRYAMQDIKLTYNNGDTDISVCNLVTVIGDQYQALDVRDNKLYYIAKLADGRCWMTQNLDLDLVHTANDADALYTHDNTDLGWTTNNSDAKWNPTRSTISLNGATSGVVSNWVSDKVGPVSGDAGDRYIPASWNGDYWSGDFVDSVYTSLSDCVTNSTTHSKEDCKHYHNGNYYNFAAAVAENDLTESKYGVKHTQVENSICPAGWRLPVSIPTGFDQTHYTFPHEQHEYAYLFDVYNVASNGYGINGDPFFDDYPDSSIALRTTPLYFIKNGGIYTYTDSRISGVGTSGGYWTSTLTGDTNESYLQTDENGAYAVVYDDDYAFGVDDSVGHDFDDASAIRCIAR
jgi:uncharacterized repeat protein (TIGR02543 family)